MDNIKKRIGDAIKEKRTEIGMTKTCAAKRAGVTLNTFVNIEDGKHMTVGSAQRVLNVFGLEMTIQTKQ